MPPLRWPRDAGGATYRARHSCGMQIAGGMKCRPYVGRPGGRRYGDFRPNTPFTREKMPLLLPAALVFAAVWRALANDSTSGNRAPGCFASPCMTTDSTAGGNRSPGRALLSGIGGCVRSCVNISRGPLAVKGWHPVRRKYAIVARLY